MNKRASIAKNYLRKTALLGEAALAAGDIISNHFGTLIGAAGLLAIAGGYVYSSSTAKSKRTDAIEQQRYQDARLTTDIENMKAKLDSEYKDRKRRESAGSQVRSMRLV